VTNEQTAADAVEHLQAAARELIAAARVVLDMAEHAIEDPGPLLALLASVAEPLVAKGRAAAAHDSPRDSPRVQHIRVS
jgi:hypothetical protein